MEHFCLKMRKRTLLSAREARPSAKPYHNSLVGAMSLQTVTLESLSQAARKTNEIPPRVSVYDVIAIAKSRVGTLIQKGINIEQGSNPNAKRHENRSRKQP